MSKQNPYHIFIDTNIIIGAYLFYLNQFSQLISQNWKRS